MNRNALVYGSYLGILGIITLSVIYLGIPNQAGLWVALGVAAVYAIFWPRWG